MVLCEKRALGRMEQALVDIPADVKVDYELAEKMVPTLVAEETPLIRYLRADDYDADAAATR